MSDLNLSLSINASSTSFQFQVSHRLAIGLLLPILLGLTGDAETACGKLEGPGKLVCQQVGQRVHHAHQAEPNARP